MQCGIVLKKSNFDLLSPRVRRGLRAKYLLLLWFQYFDKQHYHVMKNWNFEPLTVRSGEEGGVCGQNICFHVAIFLYSIWFYMQHDRNREKLNCDFMTLRSVGGMRAKKMQPCYYFSWFHIIYYSPTGYIRSNSIFWLCHESLKYFPVNKNDYWLALYLGLVSRFPVKTHRRLSTCATTMRERFFYVSNGENEAWFGNFKL